MSKFWSVFEKESMNNNNAPFLLPYSNLYLPIDFAKIDHNTKGKFYVDSFIKRIDSCSFFRKSDN